MTSTIKPMRSAVEFRPAAKADCRTIASLVSISSDGVADYVWSKQADPGEEILDVGQRRYEREDNEFSYLNTIVAENENQVIGMLLAFPISVDPEYEETDPVLSPYSKLEEDNSFYISGIALFPEYRGQGVGRQFMAIAEDKARRTGFAKLSLIVFEQNTSAGRFYQNLGYREISRETIVPHRLIHYTGDARLLVKQID